MSTRLRPDDRSECLTMPPVTNRNSIAGVVVIKLVLATTTVAISLSMAHQGKAQTSIVNAETHYCVETDNTTVGEAGVALSTCNGKPSQRFNVEEQADGYALIKNNLRNTCLSVSPNGIPLRSSVTMTRCDYGDPGQMFKPIPQGEGYALLNRQGGRCISNGDNMAVVGRLSVVDCETKSAPQYLMPGWKPQSPRPPSAIAAGMSRAQGRPVTRGIVLSGLNIKGDYSLYGSKFDGVTLTNSTITGTLKIDGVRRLRVTGNHLNSVFVRGQDTADDIVIDSNEISGATDDCVHIHDGGRQPTHVVLENNNIHDCGLKYPASGLYHAIYDQVADVVIEGNFIWNAKSAVSVRSSALIQGNVIERVTNGGAIEYYSDHPAPPDSALVLKNNVIRSTLTNAPSVLGSARGLLVLGNGIGTNKKAVSSFIVQDNTVEVLNTRRDSTGRYYVVYTQAALPNAQVSTNSFVNLIPGGDYIGPIPLKNESGNSYSHILDPEQIGNR